MNEYTQGIDLQFMSNIDEIQQQLNDLKTNFQANFTASGKSTFETTEGEEKNTIMFAEAINNFVGSNDFLSELINFQLPTTWGSMIAKLGKGLINLFSKAWDQMQEMFSYNYLSSQSVRELRLTWGLDAGEAYAYDTVADMMGISSLEDFSFMSEEELAVFQKSANKLYEIWSEYGSDTTLSDAIMEFKVNMEVLKIEMLKPLMEILNDEQSKEAIITFMKNLPDFLTKLTDVVTGLVKWLTSKGVYDQEATEEYVEKFEGTPFEYTSYELKFLDWLIKKTGGEESNLYDTFNGKKIVEEIASNGAANTTNVNNNIYIDGKEVASESKTYSSSKVNNNYSAQTNYYYGG